MTLLCRKPDLNLWKRGRSEEEKLFLHMLSISARSNAYHKLSLLPCCGRRVLCSVDGFEMEI